MEGHVGEGLMATTVVSPTPDTLPAATPPDAASSDEEAWYQAMMEEGSKRTATFAVESDPVWLLFATQLTGDTQGTTVVVHKDAGHQSVPQLGPKKLIQPDRARFAAAISSAESDDGNVNILLETEGTVCRCPQPRCGDVGRGWEAATIEARSVIATSSCESEDDQWWDQLVAEAPGGEELYGGRQTTGAVDSEDEWCAAMIEAGTECSAIREENDEVWNDVRAMLEAFSDATPLD